MRQRGAVGTALSRRDVAPAVMRAVVAQRDWLHWLGATLLGSLYPGEGCSIWIVNGSPLWRAACRMQASALLLVTHCFY